MARETFRCGDLVVTVTDTGTGKPPWNQTGAMRFAYRITVRRGDKSYSTKGWSSQRDLERGEHRRRGLSVAVVQDLANAASDPNDFASLVLQDAEDGERAKKLREANAWIRAAWRLRIDESGCNEPESGLQGRRY